MSRCFYREVECSEREGSGYRLKTVTELRQKGYGEPEHYWSDAHLMKVHGNPAPSGYVFPFLSRAWWRDRMRQRCTDYNLNYGEYHPSTWPMVAEYFTHL